MKKPPKALKFLPPNASAHPETGNDLLYKMRGLSDPFFFCFNLTEKEKILIAHGVCFVSLVMHSDSDLHLLTEDRDVRVEQLVKYIKSNFIDKNEPEPTK